MHQETPFCSWPISNVSAQAGVWKAEQRSKSCTAIPENTHIGECAVIATESAEGPYIAMMTTC